MGRVTEPRNVDHRGSRRRLGWRKATYLGHVVGFQVSHRGRRAGHVRKGCPGTWEGSRLLCKITAFWHSGDQGQADYQPQMGGLSERTNTSGQRAPRWTGSCITVMCWSSPGIATATLPPRPRHEWLSLAAPEAGPERPEAGKPKHRRIENPRRHRRGGSAWPPPKWLSLPAP